MTGPNHIIPWIPENQVELPVWTRMEALTDKVLNNWRRVVMGTLAGLAMAISSPAMAQDMVAVKGEVSQTAIAPNPEFEAIIDAAFKAKIDPLEYINSLRKEWKISFEKSREIKKYYAEKSAMDDRVRIAELERIIAARKAQEQLMDRTFAWKKEELIRSINVSNIQIVSFIEERKKRWLMNQVDKAKLMEIYEDKKTTSEEVRELIRKKFGDILKLPDLIAGI